MCAAILLFGFAGFIADMAQQGLDVRNVGGLCGWAVLVGVFVTFVVRGYRAQNEQHDSSTAPRQSTGR